MDTGLLAEERGEGMCKKEKKIAYPCYELVILPRGGKVPVLFQERRMVQIKKSREYSSDDFSMCISVLLVLQLTIACFLLAS